MSVRTLHPLAVNSWKQGRFKRPVSITITVSPDGSSPAPTHTTPPPPSTSPLRESGPLMPHAPIPVAPVPHLDSFKFSASPDYFRHGARKSTLAMSGSGEFEKKGERSKRLIRENKHLHLSLCDSDIENPRKPITGLETTYDILANVIGSGATATVMLGKNKSTNELVAIKRIPTKFILDKEFKKIGKEIKILRELNHPNLIRYQDAVITDDFLNIILDFAPGQELFDYIIDKKRLSEYETAVIIRGVARGLEHIHLKNIVHADLKPENIIIDNDDGKSDAPTSIKIIDFGLSQMISSVMRSTSETSDELLSPHSRGPASVEEGSESGGTLPYRAPELLEGSPSTPEADMWALGVILFILLSGYPPFMSEDHDPSEFLNEYKPPFWTYFQDYNQRLRDRIITADYEYFPECWEGISIGAESLMRRLLSRCPEDRPTASELLRDDWIVNLEDLPRKVAPRSPSETLDQSESDLGSSFSRKSSCDELSLSSSSTPQCFHLDESVPDTPEPEEEPDGRIVLSRSIGHELQFLDHALRDKKKLGGLRDSFGPKTWGKKRTPELDISFDD